jgi:hypothetical protein
MITRVRQLAEGRAVQFSADALDLWRRGLSVHDVLRALELATHAFPRGDDIVVVGPTIDGEMLHVVTRISDVVYVRGFESQLDATRLK